MPPDANVVRLLTSLERQRRAILSGDISGLAAATVPFGKEAAWLEGAVIQPRDRQRIQVALAENLRLLAAALAGVRAARERVLEMTRTRQELNSYDRCGRSDRIRGHASPSKDHRA